VIEYENLAKFNQPFFLAYQKSFKKTLEAGWYILGKEVENFENDFATYIGTTYCIGVASGLDALILALKACNFEKDAEIIAPSNTYIASILAIIHCGLKPILVEPDIRTYNIDPKKIINKINSKTRAILVVHLYGKACQMDTIMELAKDYNLKIIEDCAQAHGAMYQKQKVGSWGDLGAFSFYPTKNLGALGDGGAITTTNKKYAEKLRMLRNYGSTIKYYNETVGNNSRLDEIQAGFLRIKLKKLDEINCHKRKLANIYHKNLRKDFIKPVTKDDYFDIYHIYPIRHKKRNRLRDYLLSESIKTEIHYPIPPHKQKALKNYLDCYSFPISEEIHNTTLSLPLSYFHKEDDIYKVIEIINKFR